MDLRDEELNKLKTNKHLTLGDVITVNINMLKVVHTIQQNSLLLLWNEIHPGHHVTCFLTHT
jgi:hypothetical protein